MFWQSDIVTTNGRQIDKDNLLPASDDVEADNSHFTFSRKQPTARDWLEWTVFWAELTAPDLYLHRPLGRWVAPSHHKWQWFYNPLDNTMEEFVGETVRVYQPAAGGRRTRNNNVFAHVQLMSGAHPSGLPVSIERRSDGFISRKECGSSFAVCPSQPGEFLEFLRSWGGK